MQQARDYPDGREQYRSLEDSLSNGAGSQKTGQSGLVAGIRFLMPGSGREGAQACDDANLKRQERDQLRQGHDVRRGPTGVEQLLQGRLARVARMEHQEMGMP